MKQKNIKGFFSLIVLQILLFLVLNYYAIPIVLFSDSGGFGVFVSSLLLFLSALSLGLLIFDFIVGFKILKKKITVNKIFFAIASILCLISSFLVFQVVFRFYYPAFLAKFFPAQLQVLEKKNMEKYSKTETDIVKRYLDLVAEFQQPKIVTNIKIEKLGLASRGNPKLVSLYLDDGHIIDLSPNIDSVDQEARYEQVVQELKNNNIIGKKVIVRSIDLFSLLIAVEDNSKNPVVTAKVFLDGQSLNHKLESYEPIEMSTEILSDHDIFDLMTKGLYNLPLNYYYQVFVEIAKKPRKIIGYSADQNGLIINLEIIPGQPDNLFSIHLKNNLSDENLRNQKMEAFKNANLVGKYVLLQIPDEKTFLANQCCTLMVYNGEIINDKYR